MLLNNNNSAMYSSFIEMPTIPYKIIESLAGNPNIDIDSLSIDEFWKNQQIEDFWKLLKYSESDCLGFSDNITEDMSPRDICDLMIKPNLTYNEKLDLVWKNDALENNYSVFVKPLIGSSLDTAESQTQLRLYRYTTTPIDNLESVICFEADVITNEKSAVVEYNGIIVEKTDLMESLYLSIMNGRDLGIGSGYLEYNRQLSRSCNSQLNIGNSKSFYGRSIIMALRYSNIESGDMCGI